MEKIAQGLRFLPCPLELPPWRLLAGQVTYQPSIIDKPRSGADFDLNQARTELFMITDQECPHRSLGVLEFAVRVIAMPFKAQQTGGQSVDQCLPFEERRVRCTA